MQDPLIAESTYFMRRLAEVRRVAGMPASVAFDLARSPLNDDELEEAADMFGAPPSQTLGIADMMVEMLSKEPKWASVSDLRKLQENLIGQGYAPTTADANGIWDPSWYGPVKRFDRDTQDTLRSGHDWKSGPIEAGLRLITNTLPSKVWQGLVGTAKGLMGIGEEGVLPPTLERVGLLGGAAAGAAIGGAATAAFGPGAAIGAGIGAGIGAAIGFFSDLFQESDEEVDQGDWANFVDAISPWTEYANNARALWEDIGWVGAAASMVGGAGLTVSGARAGMAGIRAAQVAPVTRFQSLASGQAMAEAPWEMANVASVAAAPARELVSATPLSFGAAAMGKGVGTPGIFSRLFTAALRKTPAKGSVGDITDWITRNGLSAQWSRPGVQLINKVYTGPAAASLGGRFAAGFTGPRFDEWQGTTTIEKAIASTEPLETGIQVPLLGDLIDIPALLVFPERFFPFPKGAFGKAAEKIMLGPIEGRRLQPYAHLLQADSPKLWYRDAYAQAMEVVTPLRDARFRATFGVYHEARLRASSIAGQMSPSALEELVRRGRFDLIRTIREQGARGDFSLLNEVSKHADNAPGAFEHWLRKLKGEDRGLEWLDRYDNAESMALQIDSTLDKANLVDVGGTVVLRSTLETERGLIPTAAQKPLLAKATKPGTATSRYIAHAEYAKLMNEAKALRAKADKVGDIHARQMMMRDAATLERRANAFKSGFVSEGLVVRSPERMRVVAERLETPTRATYMGLSDEFLRLRQEVTSTFKANPESIAYVEAQGKLNTWLDDLESKGILTPDLVKKAAKPTPGKDVSKFLLARADDAARDLQLDPNMMSRLAADGYKPVLSGEDVLFTEDVRSIADGLGGNYYSRRSAVFETLGISPRYRDNIDTYKYRAAGEEAELQAVISKYELPITKERMLGLLHQGLEHMNDPSVAHFWGPIGFRGQGKMPYLYKIDLRELSPTDILDIKGLSELKGWNDEVANSVFRALHRGAAFGGEVSMRHMDDTLRLIGRELRVNGLPGFSDAIRTAQVRPKSLLALGAGLGAAEGAIVGLAEDKPIGEVVAQAVRGAAAGTIAASPLAFLAWKGHGYLPEVLIRANTALRFSLSMTFDAGRYMEQNTIAYAKYGLPFMFSPERTIARYAREGLFKKSFAIQGDAKRWDDVVALWDHVNGTNFFQTLDVTDLRQYMRGVLGFSPRDWEAAQAYLLFQRGMRLGDIRDAVSHIGRYGPGRTAAEKSANFIFFPFSFSKKLLSTLGDFMLQAPARAFLLDEGYRRFTESQFRGDVGEFLDRHLPLLKDLWQINNLSFGLSPGRFFLEGLTDNRTKLGAVMQALGHVFVPSGAATPLGQAAGALGDLSVQAFSPIVVTGESITRAGGADGMVDILKRYVPFIRELNQYFVGQGAGFPEQMKANPTWLGGEGLAPYSQFQDYVDELRLYKEELEPLAVAMGYASVDGLLNSQMGWPLKKKFEEFRAETALKYPSGEAIATQFESSAVREDAAIYELANKYNRSEGEEAIVRIAEEQWKWRSLSMMSNLPSELINGMAAQNIRKFALKYVNDRRFRELWTLLYERTYGPIALTTTATRTDEV